jgi:pimeloyl-ACP methyl ester carboxylesterase
MRVWYFLMLGGLFASMFDAFAAPVETALNDKLIARAEYRPGEAGKPTVLLVHGFLQTHEFPTIHRLIDGLNDEGYGVLAPTLSLGVTHRRQSLPCEAVHLHTMEQDAREIAHWVDWLVERKHSDVVLLGHSFGSLTALAYLTGYRNAAVKRFVGVSAVEGRLRIDEVQREQLIAQTRKKVSAKQRALMTESLSFCQKYRATPESTLSYLEWSPRRILDEVRRLPLTVSFILGSRDDRLGPNWIEQLRKTPARVHVIEGANHFMDGDFEFDLLDTLLMTLNTR